jgi:hypothetical protein
MTSRHYVPKRDIRKKAAIGRPNVTVKANEPATKFATAFEPIETDYTDTLAFSRVLRVRMLKERG